MPSHARHALHHRGLAARVRLHRRALGWTGAALIAVSASVVAFPTVAAQAVGVAAGWFLWLAGAMMILVSALVGGPRAVLAALVSGLLAIAAGAFLLFNPTAGALAATILLAAVLILEGGLELAMALDLRPLAAWRWVLASALASGVAGVVIAAAGLGSRILLALLLGLALASSGAALLAMTRPRRPRPGSARAQASVARGRPGRRRSFVH